MMMPPERLELQIQSLQIKGYGFFGYPLGYALGVGVICAYQLSSMAIVVAVLIFQLDMQFLKYSEQN